MAFSASILPVAFGNGTSKTGTTFTVNIGSSTAPVGALVAVAIAADNVGTTDAAGADGVVSVVDSAGNTYTLAAGYRNGQAGAQAGAHASLWYCVLTNALPASSTITITTSVSAYARAACAAVYTMQAGSTVSVVGSTGAAGDGGVDPVCTLSGLPGSTEYLWLAAAADETTTITGSASGFQRDMNAASSGGQAALNQSVGIYRVIDTGQTSKTFTPSLVGDNAAVLVAFKENLAPTADAWSNTDKSANIALTSSDKIATSTSVSSGGVRSTQTRTSGAAGKFYAEFNLPGTLPSDIGITATSNLLNDPDPNFKVSPASGAIRVNNVQQAVLGSFVANDVACVAWDAGAKLVWFRKNGGNWNNSGTANPATGSGGFSCSFTPSTAHALWMYVFNGTGQTATVRTKLAEYTQAVPSGFQSWMGETPVVPNVTVNVTGQGVTAATSAVTAQPPLPNAWDNRHVDNPVALSNNDKTVSFPGAYEHVDTTSFYATGKYYIEFRLDGITGFTKVRVDDYSTRLIAIDNSGVVTFGGATGYTLSPPNAGDIIGIAVDLTANLGWLRVNGGNWNNFAPANPATGSNGKALGTSNWNAFGVGEVSAVGTAITVNTGQNFVYKNPAGFASWYTTPSVTIPVTAPGLTARMGHARPQSNPDAWDWTSAWYPPFQEAFTNNDKTFTSEARAFSQTGHATGKYYAELITDDVGVGGYSDWGVEDGLTDARAALDTDGYIYGDETLSDTAQVPVDGDTLCIAVNLDTRMCWFRLNGGVWNDNALADPATGVGGCGFVSSSPAFLYASLSPIGTTTINTGPTFARAKPAGFADWYDPSAISASVAVASPAITAAVGTVTVVTAVPVAITVPVGGGARAWTPADLGTDLSVWYDFADASTISQSGGYLTAWNDKSGNVRHGVAATTGTLAVNSDGIYLANGIMGPNLGIQMPTMPSAYFDFAFAGKPNPAGSFRTLMAQAAGGQHHVLVETGSNNLGNYSNAWFPAGSLQWPSVDGQVYFVGIDATNIRIGRDGATPVDLVGENFAPDAAPFLFNYSVQGGQGWGTAREFVFMTANRPQATQEKVSGYLAWKWDAILGVTTHVTALPGGHPYKSAAPMVGAGDAALQLSAAVGGVTAKGNTGITGQAVTTAVGQVSVAAATNASTLVASPAMASAVGQVSVTARIGVTIVPASPAITAAVGTITVSLPVSGAVVAPVYRSSTFTGYANTGTSRDGDKPAGTAADDILLASCFQGRSDTDPPDATPPSGFTRIGSASILVDPSFFHGKFELYWKRATASEPATYTFGTAGSTQIVVVAYSGCPPTGSPFDTFAFTSAVAGTVATASGIVTTQANDKLIWYGHNWDASGTLTPPSGMAERVDSLTYVADETIVSPATTGDRAQGQASNNPWAVFMLGLKGIGGVGGEAVTVIPTGQALTASVGQVGVSAGVSRSTLVASPAMAAAVGQVGVTARVNISTLVASPAMAASVGQVTASGKSNVSIVPVGQEVIASGRGVSVTAGTSVMTTVSSGLATVASGDLIVHATSRINALASALAASVGQVAVTARTGITIVPATPGLTSGVGQISVAAGGSVSVIPAGQQIAASVGPPVISTAVRILAGRAPGVSVPATTALAAFTPGGARNDFTGEVGVRLNITADTEFNWLAAGVGGLGGGLQRVAVYDWFESALGGGGPTNGVTTAYTPGYDRDNHTGEVGVRIRPTSSFEISWIGVRYGGGVATRKVNLYAASTDTLLRSATIDLTGKAIGEYGWASIAPLTLAAGQDYGLMAETVSGSGAIWASRSAVTMPPFISTIFSAYRMPGGGLTADAPDEMYVGLDLGWGDRRGLIAETWIDTTGKELGSFVWKPVTPFTLLAGGYYALVADVMNGGPTWANAGPVSANAPFIGDIYSCYRGSVVTSFATGGPNTEFFGLDIGIAPASAGTDLPGLTSSLGPTTVSAGIGVSTLVAGQQITAAVGAPILKTMQKILVAGQEMIVSGRGVTVTAGGAVSTTVSSGLATTAAGQVGVAATHRFSITGTQAAVSVGQVTATGKSNVSTLVAGQGVTASVGTVGVSAGGSVSTTLAGQQINAAVGQVGVRADRNISHLVSGQQVTVGAGTPSVTAGGSVSIPVASPALTAAAGQVSVTAKATVVVIPTSPAITASFGEEAVSASVRIIAGRGALPFAPSDIGGLNDWLDASALMLADGSRLAAWPNLSGGAQPTIIGAPGPEFKTGAQNSLPVIRFRSGESGLRCVTTLPNVQNYSLLYACRWIGPGVGRAFTAQYPPSNFLVGMHTSQFDTMYDNGTWMGGAAYPPQPGPWRMYGADGVHFANSRFIIDGSVVASNGPGAGGGLQGGWAISGYEASTNEMVDLEVAELVLYDHRLIDAERQQVEGYIAHKWGLQANLPAGHPYRSEAPSGSGVNLPGLAVATSGVGVHTAIGAVFPVTGKSVTASVGQVGVSAKKNVIVSVSGQSVAAAVGAVAVEGAGMMTVWTGAKWELKPAKVWTGTAWVSKPVKQWNVEEEEWELA